MKRKVEVSLLGQKFTVSSDKDAAYIHGLASFVGRRFEELQRSTRTKSTHELALLVALNLADELFQAEAQTLALQQDVRVRTERALARVDAALAADDTGHAVAAKSANVDTSLV
jgi:cell division protein ZapA (FtsZ GTPase activity inhibitor)